MNERELPDEFLRLLRSVTAKRPRTVIDHILKHGQITTEELRTRYGYSHPPRAARDVRELGIPLVTFRVTGSDGRTIGAYRFGDPGDVRSTHLSGRTALTAKIKSELLNQFGPRCNISLEVLPERDLQIDHRVPFQIAGDDSPVEEEDAYMLLSPSANRAKSWSCEHCQNWQLHDVDICRGCYWAFPETYTHVAMRDERRLDLIWSGDEVRDYEQLVDEAQSEAQSLPSFVKAILQSRLDRP